MKRVPFHHEERISLSVIRLPLRSSDEPKFLWAAEQVVKSKLHGKLIAYNIHVYHGK